MNNTSAFTSRVSFTTAALLLGLAANAYAAAPRAADPLHERYLRERAVCTSGQSNQDRATCLREAEAAYAQLRQGAAGAPASSPDALAANALKRCIGLPEPERGECRARVQGEGSTTGSVAGGGILRELVTIVPAPAPAPAKPAVVSPATAPR